MSSIQEIYNRYLLYSQAKRVRLYKRSLVAYAVLVASPLSGFWLMRGTRCWGGRVTVPPPKASVMVKRAEVVWVWDKAWEERPPTRAEDSWGEEDGCLSVEERGTGYFSSAGSLRLTPASLVSRLPMAPRRGTEEGREEERDSCGREGMSPSVMSMAAEEGDSRTFLSSVMGTEIRGTFISSKGQTRGKGDEGGKEKTTEGEQTREEREKKRGRETTREGELMRGRRDDGVKRDGSQRTDGGGEEEKGPTKGGEGREERWREQWRGSDRDEGRVGGTRGQTETRDGDDGGREKEERRQRSREGEGAKETRDGRQERRRGGVTREETKGRREGAETMGGGEWRRWWEGRESESERRRENKRRGGTEKESFLLTGEREFFVSAVLLTERYQLTLHEAQFPGNVVWPLLYSSEDQIWCGWMRNPLSYW
jgi:hypothetical protein